MHPIKLIMNEFKNVGNGTIKISISDGIAVLKLSNTPKKNALSPVMMAEMSDKLSELSILCNEEMNPLYGLVLCGENQTFCSGFDLNAANIEFSNHEMGAKMATLMHHNFIKFHKLPLISIAAIEGFGFGGGAELTTWCDHRVMADDALVKFVEVQMGITTGWAGGYNLKRILGHSKALNVLAASPKMTSADCYNLGYVDKECASGTAEATAIEWLKKYYSNAKGSVSALRGIKKVIQISDDVDLENILEKERTIFCNLWGGVDNRKAIDNFMQHKK